MTRYKILSYDPYLAPYERDIALRMANYADMRERLLGEGLSLSDFANGRQFYGFHQTGDGWVYREWAPNAEQLYLIGDFNGWNRESHPMRYIGNGNYEIVLPDQNALAHGMQVRVLVCTKDGAFDRIPLYITRTLQQPDHRFNGVIWAPKEGFPWTDAGFKRDAKEPIFIYECHVGMSGEQYHISTFRDFTDEVLPRIQRAGYNTIQLMAVMQHPYYGSFGYQVTNFFAVSSWFGTPDDLKNLINTAHTMGIAVFLDLVHSHAANNAVDGIAGFDGTQHQFFHAGARGDHPAWGTKVFDYGKPEVVHFLLSNIKYWLEEYHFDGLRFDGITSMLYRDHGMSSFTEYAMYFSHNTDTQAITYLQLAAELSKEINPDCVLIAEDMSGMPGMCLPIAEGGIGFDYRLGMGMPDFWIKTLRDARDEDWSMGQLWYELTQRRPREKVIGYCESHDQALVGDKTIMFWLADQEMYWHMSKFEHNDKIDRAVALHKMIRLITCACAGEGYLNFMGNEFGHPEWIDFPRESNGWSFHYARRQWRLADDDTLRYAFLLAFDRAMVELLKGKRLLLLPTVLLVQDEESKALAFTKGDYLFAFNFHPRYTYIANVDPAPNYGYDLVLNTNWEIFGGAEANESGGGPAYRKSQKNAPLVITLPRRTALVCKLML